MQVTAEVLTKVSQALPYPEPLRVTGPLQSLVLRAEDMWRKYKSFFIEVFGFRMMIPKISFWAL